MSDGYICTPEELELSISSSNSQIHCLTRGQSFGLLLNAESASLSIIAVLLVFALLLRRLTGRAKWAQTPIDLYIISLFIAHFILALGMIMDSKWVHEGKVQVGTYCTTQGAFHQLGAIGVALSTLVIALHTFLFVWCRVEVVHRLKLAYAILGTIWPCTILFVFVGIGIYTDPKHGEYYETPTPYWCWIGHKYTAERIVFDYLHLWLALLVSLLTYIPLYFWAKGRITPGENWWNFRVIRRSDSDEDSTDLELQQKRRALNMIAYPLVYSILFLPLSIVRWITFSRNDKDTNMPSIATFIVINIYALGGAFTAALFLYTRRDLFRTEAVFGAP